MTFHPSQHTGEAHIWVNTCWWLFRCWVIEGWNHCPLFKKSLVPPVPHKYWHSRKVYTQSMHASKHCTLYVCMYVRTRVQLDALALTLMYVRAYIRTIPAVMGSTDVMMILFGMYDVFLSTF